MTIFQNIRKGLIPARLSVDEVYALTEAGVFREGELARDDGGAAEPRSGSVDTG